MIAHTVYHSFQIQVIAVLLQTLQTTIGSVITNVFIFMHHVEKNCECLVPVQGGLIHIYCMYISLFLEPLYPFEKITCVRKCFIILEEDPLGGVGAGFLLTVFSHWPTA